MIRTIRYDGLVNKRQAYSIYTRPMFVLVISLINTLTFSTAHALANNATTVGTLTTSTTFNTIWVKATYTGDSNNNNSFILQYRENSAVSWLNAYAPPPDRRISVAGGIGNASNRYQFRAGVFGLAAGRTYDVRVKYHDPDGVTGGQVLSTTATLLSDSIVVGNKRTYYLDDVGVNGDGSSGSPFNSFANAFAGTACGDRLIVRDGTYAAFTFSKACTATSWYVIEAENVNRPSINDAAMQVISIEGDFVKITGLNIPTATCAGVKIQANRHDVWIDQLRIEDVGTSVTAIGHAAAYGCNGIRYEGGTHHIYLTNNRILGQTLTSYGPASVLYDTCCNGIGGESAGPSETGVFVIKGNTIQGGFRDGIGNSPENSSGGMNWSDIISNTVSNFVDDGIQMEGGNIGLVVQGNVVQSSNAYACFAAQTGFFGPMYWIRNTCRLTSSGVAGYAWKAGGLQFGIIFHNSVETLNANHDGLYGGPDTAYLIARNNIFKTQGNTLYRILENGVSFDYNLYYRGNPTIARLWNNTTDYALDGFRVIGQERHGQFADPLYLDAELHVNTVSPAYNAGVSIPNINDAASAWPSQGGRPDMGVFEVDTAPVLPVGAPRNLHAQ